MEKLAATLYALDILFLLSFQVLNREFTLLPQAVSGYGLGKTAGLFRAYLLAGSVAAPLLGWQFWMSKAPVFPVAVPVYLGLVALGRIGIAIYPNHPRGAPESFARQMHHAATLLAFTCAYMAVVEATPILAGHVEHGLPEALEVLRHLISLGFLAVVLTISPPLRRFFGLAERLFLYATAVWFLTASLTLPPL
ncbi:MAG: DUF998 domain-containing protein [Cypionkella sp.]